MLHIAYLKCILTRIINITINILVACSTFGFRH